ncbi:MAG: zf-HC2 domain-containing protein [Acidobacteria bacterium]|nr:zf-HC2 domain-containing protein [Acidobacteriota bacterium]
MRCEECQLLIERYFDGELGEPSAGLVAGHVAVCASCARAYRRLEREQDFYLRHESDLEVSPAFWSGVFAKVAQDQASRPAWNFHSLWERSRERLVNIGAIRFGLLSTAAIVLLSIGVTAGVMKYIYSRERVSVQTFNSHGPRGSVTPAITQGRPEALAGSRGDLRAVNQTSAGSGGQGEGGGSMAKRPELKPVANRRRPAPEELVREAEHKYLTAIALLSRDANRRRSHLDSEALAQFDQTLATVDRAIAGTRRVARGRPDDPVAVQYMLAAYAKKVDVLRQMVIDQ